MNKIETLKKRLDEQKVFQNILGNGGFLIEAMYELHERILKLEAHLLDDSK